MALHYAADKSAFSGSFRASWSIFAVAAFAQLAAYQAICLGLACKLPLSDERVLQTDRTSSVRRLVCDRQASNGKDKVPDQWVCNWRVVSVALVKIDVTHEKLECHAAACDR